MRSGGSGTDPVFREGARTWWSVFSRRVLEVAGKRLAVGRDRELRLSSLAATLFRSALDGVVVDDLHGHAVGIREADRVECPVGRNRIRRGAGLAGILSC